MAIPTKGMSQQFLQTKTSICIIESVLVAQLMYIWSWVLKLGVKLLALSWKCKVHWIWEFYSAVQEKKRNLKSVKSIAFPGFLARTVVVVVDNSLLFRIISFCVPDCSHSCLLKTLIRNYVYFAQQEFPWIGGISPLHFGSSIEVFYFLSCILFPLIPCPSQSAWVAFGIYLIA